jgi:hypothetical protein
LREIYLMALYATRARGGEASDEVWGEGEHEVALRVALAVGRDEAEARVRARARLLELCPPEEGWVNHHVALSELSRDELRAVFESLSEDEDAEGGTRELIM